MLVEASPGGRIDDSRYGGSRPWLAIATRVSSEGGRMWVESEKEKAALSTSPFRAAEVAMVVTSSRQRR